MLTGWGMVLAAVLKTLFILLVVVGAFAPVMVWADRRQSAMMQDRVGPHRADIPLGKWFPSIVDSIRSTLTPLRLGATACVAGAVVLFVIAGWEMAFGRDLLVVGGLDEATETALVDQGYVVSVLPSTSMLEEDMVDGIDLAYTGSLPEAQALEAKLADMGESMPIGYAGGEQALDVLSTAPAAFGLTMSQVLLFGFLLLLGAGVLRVGHKVHAGIVENGGSIRLLGLLHPAADALKMIVKEDFMPPKADKLLYSLAPIITMIPAVASFAVIPFADVLWLDYAGDMIFDGVAFETVGTRLVTSGDTFAAWAGSNPGAGVAVAGSTMVPMQVASLNVGVLFIFAIAGTGVVGAALAGYASDNKFSLMGGLRAASQMVSYEVALGLTVVPCFMLYGSLRLEEMAAWQVETGVWGIFFPPLTVAAILYFTAAIAETKRIPFDVPEGESELVAGYFTEYSGMKFGMFMTGEFIEMVVLSGLAAVFFFGGWDVPFLFSHGFDLPGNWSIGIPLTDLAIADTILMAHWGVIAIQVAVFLLKLVLLVWFQIQIRWTLPRFRYDQIMALCWKGLLPLSLVNILITGLLILLWG